MKLKYLGTAAAEGVPALFCDCEVCQKSMKLGGKNIRTRSQAIIDNTLLIDFPPDTYWHFIQNNLPMDKIEHCIVTHSHQDHLYELDIFMRKKGFANFKEPHPPLNFYTGKDGFKKISKVINDAYKDNPERFVERLYDMGLVQPMDFKRSFTSWRFPSVTVITAEKVFPPGFLSA